MRRAICLGIICVLGAAAHAAVIGKATVTADQAPVMSGKQVVVTAKKGDTFDVTEVKGDWFGVAPSHGWIHKSNVRYEPAGPGPGAVPPWQITKAWLASVAPDGRGTFTLAFGEDGCKYLYLDIEFAKPPDEDTLKGFSITDSRGTKVGSLYGSRKQPGLLIFEGDWKGIAEYRLVGMQHSAMLLGKTGETPAAVVQPAPAQATAAAPAVIGKATVTADQAPVMSGNQVIATAAKGVVFDVTEVKGDWFGVAPSQGWIHKSHVRYDAQLPPSPVAPPVLAPAGGQKELTLDLGGGVTMKMILIRPGRFMMGSPASEAGRDDKYDEGPEHEVTITRSFYMGVTEVTQAQYEAVMGKNPSEFKGATKAVDLVSWDDATEFCKKLSDKTRQVVRLPTEAEWEYACRAGTQTAFSFGDSHAALGDYAWWVGNSDKTTHPVGQKKPNAWGLYDMHGNVFEWCADWHGEYPKGPVTDPFGPATGRLRVMRGGSWYHRLGVVPSGYFRCAFRNGYGPSYRDNGLGFRCAMTLR